MCQTLPDANFFWRLLGQVKSSLFVAIISQANITYNVSVGFTGQRQQQLQTQLEFSKKRNLPPKNIAHKKTETCKNHQETKIQRDPDPLTAGCAVRDI